MLAFVFPKINNDIFISQVHELQISRFSPHLQEYNDSLTQKLNNMRKRYI